MQIGIRKAQAQHLEGHLRYFFRFLSFFFGTLRRKVFRATDNRGSFVVTI